MHLNYLLEKHSLLCVSENHLQKFTFIDQMQCDVSLYLFTFGCKASCVITMFSFKKAKAKLSRRKNVDEFESKCTEAMNVFSLSGVYLNVCARVLFTVQIS